MDCFVAPLLAMTETNERQPPAWCGDCLSINQSTNYFGYLNSGAAFSASLVVFIDASHLSFLVS